MKNLVVTIAIVSGSLSCEAFSMIQPRRFTLTPLFVGDPTGSQHNQFQDDSISQNVEENQLHGDDASLKANRWSKHAPDANLPTDEFKSKLKENMKGDLESRRASLPNRGNQPAKHYLDSL